MAVVSNALSRTNAEATFTKLYGRDSDGRERQFKFEDAYSYSLVQHPVASIANDGLIHVNINFARLAIRSHMEGFDCGVEFILRHEEWHERTKLLTKWCRRAEASDSHNPILHYYVERSADRYALSTAPDRIESTSSAFALTIVNAYELYPEDRKQMNRIGTERYVNEEVDDILEKDGSASLLTESELAQVKTRCLEKVNLLLKNSAIKNPPEYMNISANFR